MTSETQLSPNDYETLADFRHALRTFAKFSAEAARKTGLTTQQHQALLAIKGHRGPEAIAIGRLAERLIIAPHTAAELVMRLEMSGLVTKLEAADDRRKVRLGLTEKAEAALAKLTRAHLQEVRLLAPRIMGLIRDLEAQKTDGDAS